MVFRIDSADSLNVTDPEIGCLLTEVYVESGLTSSDRAVALFSPPAVRSRGQLICARSQREAVFAGMVIVVPPDSPARHIAYPDETEMHLLAVRQAYRGFGLGRALVRAATAIASQLGYHKMVLWTQPIMTAAQALYESEGFLRASDRYPTMNGIKYLAYDKQWQPVA